MQLSPSLNVDPIAPGQFTEPAAPARADTIQSAVRTRGRAEYDVVVVGPGPNGLAAAITFARAGLSVLVVEAKASCGGGARSASLTLPGFVHDVCSAVHPLGIASPFLKDLPLAEHGLSWVHPEAPLAHPLDYGRAVVLTREVEATAVSLGVDAHAYARLFQPFVRRCQALLGDILDPIAVPRHPLLFAQFGLRALHSIDQLARSQFQTEEAKALVAGCGAHSFVSFEAAFGAAFSLVLGITAHAVGWPVARGGSQAIVDALVGHLATLGGEVELDHNVTNLAELPKARAYVLDVSPRSLASIAGERLPARYRAKLRRYRPAPGVFKVDWALSDPIPWTAGGVRGAGTVHVVGSVAELRASEEATLAGRIASRPFVLLSQPTVCDPSRALKGKHVGWAYCHVPFGSSVDMTDAIEAQVERFAPGFRDCILARATRSAAQYGAYNANNEGGDIAGGASDAAQLFARPVLSLSPYSTPARDIYLCSASTPPGGGVHGMSGHLAAVAALRRVFGLHPKGKNHEARADSCTHS